MNNKQFANINHLWAALIIEELIRNGVDYFCVAPGSRSAPLAVAVSENKGAKTLVHFDERGLGFHALGFCSATKKPCAVICTSATALANLFPAIIEASKKKVPLLILTADRPPELRFTGANQTIDQVKIFGDYVRWFFDMPTPTEDISPEFILTTIDQAVYRTKGELKGPVHLNCMFREPLVPIKTKKNFFEYTRSIKEWLISKEVYTQYELADMTLDSITVNKIAESIKEIKNGVILVGKLSSANERESVIKIAQRLNWPIFPDISSGLRLTQSSNHVIHCYDQILLSSKWLKYKVDGVLHLGGRITSKRLMDYIKKVNPQHYIMVLNHPLRNDPDHSVSQRIQCKVNHFNQVLLNKLPLRKSNKLLTDLQKANKIITKQLGDFVKKENKLSELAVVHLIARHIDSKNALFVSNSLPIREIDMFGALNTEIIEIGANRGASGIDGIISSATGFSVGLKKGVTLLIGDLAFLYDMNSLAILKDLAWPMTIVVLNNNGGGIFSFLPIAEYKQSFEKYFATPHQLTFEFSAKMFGLNYFLPKTVDEFTQFFQKSIKGRQHTLIEVQTDRNDNVSIQRKFQRIVVNE